MQDLMGQMVRNGRVLMRADGPYGQPYGYNWRQYTSMVIIAGGIGSSLPHNQWRRELRNLHDVLKLIKTSKNLCVVGSV